MLFVTIDPMAKPRSILARTVPILKPELNPDVEDEAPSTCCITAYDESHYVTYLRLLDANSQGADWREVALIVLHRDPAADELRIRRCWESHLARAQWMAKSGYWRILQQARDGR